ncbi:cytochrome c biogenesis CcdA family protein [Bacillus sp. 1P06AnD]|uniref:cytochrome c biogenesis CcdA family protein n=1 Tax=Bacillus sp. 1P06AnD TaxID=3132208 RepID=UPI0039A2D6FB
MFYIEYLIVFAAGIALFFSTCIFPLVPTYMSQLTGKQIKQAKLETEAAPLAYHTVLFMAGYVLCLSLIGSIGGWAGTYLSDEEHFLLKLAGLALIIFGFLLTGLLNVRIFMRGRKHLIGPDKKSGMSSFISGILYSISWTPGIGLLSISILLLSIASSSWFTGLLLELCFSAGVAIPFILFSTGLSRSLNNLRFMNRHLGKVTFVTGMMLVLLGFLIFSGHILNTHSLFATGTF